jgi:hypothetical protein
MIFIFTLFKIEMPIVFNGFFNHKQTAVAVMNDPSSVIPK